MAARKTKFEARISGHGVTVEGRRAFTVASQSEANLHHIVVVYSDRLECDCYRSVTLGLVCTHRRLVHDRLVAERDAAAAKMIAFSSASNARTVRTQAPATHESPALKDDTRAFSIFKQ